MKCDFITKPLSSLADIQTGPFGSQLHKEDYVNIGTPIVTVEHLGNRNFSMQNLPYVSDKDKERLGKYILKEGDIVFSRVGSVDRCSYVSGEYIGWLFSGRCLRIRPTKEIYPLYLYYFFTLEETKQFMRGIATGATMPSLNTKFMGETPITYPSIENQYKIAKILSTLDDKIELNQKINDNLERQVSLLYSYFFEKSIPKEWKVGALSDIAYVSSGKRPPMKSAIMTERSNIPIVGAADVMGFTNEANHSNKILVIGRVGTHGVVQRFNSPCWTSDNTLVITSEYYEYLYQILKRIDYNSLNRGSTQPLITQGDINKVSVIIPDKDTLAKYEKIAETLMSKYEANIIESIKLSKIRDTILPRLMSGELDVSNLEI